MKNTKTILLYNITPEELKDLIIVDLKIELKTIFQQANEPENYSVQEVSKLLRCSELTVYNYIKKGFLPASKIGRKFIIKKDDFENSFDEFKSLKYRR